MKLKKSIVSDSVKRALLEDGYNNDLSLKAKNISTKNVLKASLISREAGILSGSLWFEESFKQIDKKAKIKWNVIEGEAFKKDNININEIFTILTSKLLFLIDNENFSPTPLNGLKLYPLPEEDNAFTKKCCVIC